MGNALQSRAGARPRYLMASVSPIIAIAAGLILSGPAAAQTKIEQMIVTATKRAQDLQSVPASISAFSGDLLDNRGIKNVEDLTKNTPNLHYAMTGGTNPQIGIRGVSPDGTSTLLEGTVAMHIDGVYNPRVYSLPLAMFDLESVEVLRGPQGTVYGRNANAGVINLITAKPTDVFEAKATIWGGDRGGFRYGAKGYVSGPVMDGISIRLAGIVNRDDGFTKNVTSGDWIDGSNSFGGRLSVRLQPTDDLTIDLSATHFKDSFEQNFTVSTAPAQGPTGAAPAGGNGGLHNYTNLRNFYGAAATEILLQPWKTNSSFNPDHWSQQDSATAIITWEVTPDITVKSINGYQYAATKHLLDQDGFAAEYLPAPPYGDSWSWSSELNVNAKLFDGFVDAVAGLYYMHDRVKGGNLNPIPPGNPVPVVIGTSALDGLYLYNIMDQDTDSRAAFLDLTFNVFDNLRVLSGVRRTIDRRDTTQQIRTFINANPNFPSPFADPDGSITLIAACPNTANPGIDQPQQVFNSTTFKAGVQYDFTPDIMGYVQWQNGFKDGGYNVSLCNNQYQPEKIYSWEFGLKTTLFNGTTNLNVTWFDYRYINMQLSRTINLSPTVITSLIDNASTSSIQGAEIELVTNLTDEWSADLNIGYLDAHYGDITPDAAGNVGARNGAVPGNPLINYSQFTLPRAPKYTINAGLTYEQECAGWGNFRVRGEYAYRSKTYFTPFNEPIATQGGYSEWNAYVNFTPESNPDLDFQIFCKNCANKFSRSSMFTSGIMYMSRSSFAPSREIGAQVTAKF